MAEQEHAITLPAGFTYRENFLTQQEENELLATIDALQFQTFEYRGFAVKRRVLAYGWSYDFNANLLSRGPEIPDVLLPVRSRLGRVKVQT